MKQILQSYKTGELWLADVPAPACGRQGAVIKTCSSFVSAGTERMLIDFAKKNILAKAVSMPDQVRKVLKKIKTEGLTSTVDKVRAKLNQPIPLGYSCAGIVEAVGESVSDLKVGDRVACGGAGYADHAEYNFVPNNLIVKIPGNVSFEDASCATVGSIALQGVRQCDAKLGETVCVMGLGLIGCLAVQMFKAAGVRVIGFDPDVEKCNAAKKCGADVTVSENIDNAGKDFSDGHGVDAVLITAGTSSNQPVDMAGEICRLKGRVVILGLVGMTIPRDTYYKKELDIRMSLSYGPGRYDREYEEKGHDYPFGYVRWTEQRNMKAFLDLVACGKLDLSLLITHRFDFENALEAYSLLLGERDEDHLGIVLNYGDTGNHQYQEKRTISLGKENIREMDGESLVVGVVGAGNFCRGMLLPELKKHRHLDLKGICTVTGKNAAEIGKAHGFEYATTDYKAILVNEKIDTVFIMTRHDTHSQMVCEALNAGKHVFVEKPFCLDEEQLEAIKKSYAATERQELMVGFNRRFSSHTRLLAEYFKKRTTPMMLTYRINAGHIPPASWIQDPECGGGRIIGEACHFIDFATHIVQAQPVQVQAMCIDTQNTTLTVSDNISFTVKYNDGSIAHFFYVAVGTDRLEKERCEIFADESAAVLEDFKQTVCKGKLGKRKLRTKQSKGFTEEISAFLQAVEKNNPTDGLFDSYVDTTKTTFAVLKALRSQKTVLI